MLVQAAVSQVPFATGTLLPPGMRKAPPLWEVEDYVGDTESSFANKVYATVDKVSLKKDHDAAGSEHKAYSVVDKVSYLNGQEKLMNHLMPERCDAIEDEVIDSTSTDVAYRS